MIRHCDGTDPNLVGQDGYPCECGEEFDDVDHLVLFPHMRITKLTEEEKQKIIDTWFSEPSP
jgi:hypothetical protein